MKAYFAQRGPGRTIRLWKIEKYGRRLSMPTDDIAGRILADVFGPRLLQEDFHCYQSFKETVITPRLDQGTWTLTEDEIRDWSETFRARFGRRRRGSVGSAPEGFATASPPWGAGAADAEAAAMMGFGAVRATRGEPASSTGLGAPGEPCAMVTWPSGVTRAQLVQSTPHVVLLEGDGPVGSPPPVGTLLRLRLPGSRDVAPARLAAYGKGGRFLVALGTRGVRGAARVRVDLPATIRGPHLYGAEQVRVVDLSSSGARLRGLVLPAGSDLELKLVPPGRHQAVSMRCVVIHTLDSDPPEMGVAFAAGSLSFSIELARP